MKQSIFRPGFTLLELVVVLGIFSLTAILAVDIFITISNLQRQVRNVQSIQSDARFVLEAMAQEAKMGTIDYGYYTSGLQQPVSILAIRDQDQNQVFYQHNSGTKKIQVCSNTVQNPTLCEDSLKWQDVTPPTIDVKNLQFYIIPSSDPFSKNIQSCQNSNCGVHGTCVSGFCTVDFQPMVTMILEAESQDQDASKEKINIQTTVTSMVYRR